jgi:hypothetical protein
MTEQEVYKKLSEEAPTGHRLNELIPFSYPVRKIQIDILANKQPDQSLVKVYNVLLRTAQMGFHTQSEIFYFLGLDETDEFILRELYTLREKGYLDLVSEKWMVTESGEQFIKDNAILRVLEEEEFEFLIDGISGEIMSAQGNPTRRGEPLKKSLPFEINLPIKSPDLLENKEQALADIYKCEQGGSSYLVDYNPEEIKKDYEVWCDYWLIEYIPERNSNQEPYMEVRSHSKLKINQKLTDKFNSEYQRYIYKLSDSERKEVVELPEIAEEEQIETQRSAIESVSFENLTNLGIWETKQKFIEALETVKEKILIESPWIKRATQEYLSYFEKILKDKKKLIILYGYEGAEHDYHTMTLLTKLRDEHPHDFILKDLPEYFKSNGIHLKGTHRKLVIKDSDYFISGSFNFLSFAGQEGKQVSNEESNLISVGVKEKWEQVKREYKLKI